MKKIFFIIILSFAAKSFPQNLQIHYDFGEDRKYITTTLEMFKPDEFGSTFLFIDFDYNLSGNKSISLAYFEIARYITIYNKLSLTIQYNDGLVSVPVQDIGNIAVTLNQSWLGGINYPIDLGFVILNTDLLAKKIHNSKGIDGQLTIVWFLPFIESKINFTGFLDVWSQDKLIRGNLDGGKEIVFLAEPQIWYNIINHLAVGTEIEISNNFLPLQSEIKVMPTLAVKWNF